MTVLALAFVLGLSDFDRARSALDAGEWSAARAACQRFVTAHPADTLVPAALLLWAGLEPDPESALVRYRQVWTTFPTSPLAVQAQLAAGKLLFARARYADCRDRFEAVRARGPSPARAEALFWLGITYHGALDADSAARVVFQELRDCCPGTVWAARIPVLAPKTTPVPVAAESTARPAWFVQVGSFRTRGNADQLKARLAADGYPVELRTLERDGATLWRVLVGPLTGSAVAESTRVRLKAAGIDGILIRPS